MRMWVNALIEDGFDEYDIYTDYEILMESVWCCEEMKRNANQLAIVAGSTVRGPTVKVLNMPLNFCPSCGLKFEVITHRRFNIKRTRLLVMKTVIETQVTRTEIHATESGRDSPTTLNYEQGGQTPSGDESEHPGIAPGHGAAFDAVVCESQAPGIASGPTADAFAHTPGAAHQERDRREKEFHDSELQASQRIGEFESAVRLTCMDSDFGTEYHDAKEALFKLFREKREQS